MAIGLLLEDELLEDELEELLELDEELELDELDEDELDEDELDEEELDEELLEPPPQATNALLRTAISPA